MTIWDVLGIEPTADEVEIRRAYSAMLKLHRPDEDPDGYQRLRRAYEAALAIAKKPEILQSADLDGEAAWEEPEETLPKVILIQGPTAREKVDAFIGQVKELYDDFSKRIEIAQWEELLKSEVLSDLGAHDQIAKQMPDVLSQRHHFPREIWRLLENHFHWTTESAGYEQQYQFLIRYIDRQCKIGLTETQYRRFDPAGAESYMTDLDLLAPIGELFDREECERRRKALAEKYPDSDEIYVMEQLYYQYYIEEKVRFEDCIPKKPERMFSILSQLTEIAPQNLFFKHISCKLYIIANEPVMAEHYYQQLLNTADNEERMKEIQEWYIELKEYGKNVRANYRKTAGEVSNSAANAVLASPPVNDNPAKTPTKRSLRDIMNSKHSIWLLLAIIGSTVKYINRLNHEAAMILLAILVGGYIILKIWAKKA